MAVARWAQRRQERSLTCPRKLPALAAVKTTNAPQLQRSCGISRAKSGCSPARMQNTIRTVPKPKVIEAAHPRAIQIKTVNGRIPYGSYTLARALGLL